MFRASNIALTAAFIALAVTLGFLLAAVPNVELVTLTVFLGGAATGKRNGLVIGGLSALLYFGLLNPYGASPPYILVAQVLGEATAGWCGGRFARRLVTLPSRRQPLTLGLVGCGMALVFQILVNGALGLHFGRLMPTIIGGLFFSILQVVSNALAFAVLGVPGLRILVELGALERPT